MVCLERLETRVTFFLILVKAIMKKILPEHGRTFLENRELATAHQLRTAMTDWLSTRAPSNPFKPLTIESKDGGYQR